MKIVDYYIPKTKAELLRWFKWNGIKGVTGKPKEQLYALYHSFMSQLTQGAYKQTKRKAIEDGT